MKIGFTAFILTAGVLLLPAATVAPCVPAGESEDTAAQVATEGQDQENEAPLPICDANPAGVSPTNVGIAAGGLLTFLLARNDDDAAAVPTLIPTPTPTPTTTSSTTVSQ